MAVKTSQEAFDYAIYCGLLSANPEAQNYAGHYMYMHTENGHDYFKRIDTREYIRTLHCPGPDYSAYLAKHPA